MQFRGGLKTNKLIRAAALLLMVCLCTATVSAASTVHEEDYEVLPDYSQMDTETAITPFLRRELKLNRAAVCGILANMEYEADFSPTAWGDDGTSYGLCQWHESRCRSLFSFCQETGEKYHSSRETYYAQIRGISNRMCREHGLSVRFWWRAAVQRRNSPPRSPISMTNRPRSIKKSAL